MRGANVRRGPLRDSAELRESYRRCLRRQPGGPRPAPRDAWWAGFRPAPDDRPLSGNRGREPVECAMGLDARFVGEVLPRCCSFCALATVAVATAHAAESVPARPLLGGLEGDWETVIESPRRPWAFVIHFVRSGNGWTGAMTFPGFPDFPLHEVRAESTTIHFRFPPELDSIVFEGTWRVKRSPAGCWSRASRFPRGSRAASRSPLPRPARGVAAGSRLPDHAPGRIRPQLLSRGPGRLPACHGTPQPRSSGAERRPDPGGARFGRRVERQRPHPDAPRSDARGNFTTEFPLRMAWFADGCFVVKAAPKQARALRRAWWRSTATISARCGAKSSGCSRATRRGPTT